MHNCFVLPMPSPRRVPARLHAHAQLESVRARTLSVSLIARWACRDFLGLSLALTVAMFSDLPTFDRGKLTSPISPTRKCRQSHPVFVAVLLDVFFVVIYLYYYLFLRVCSWPLSCHPIAHPPFRPRLLFISEENLIIASIIITICINIKNNDKTFLQKNSVPDLFIYLLCNL